jgi:hypothetical protein
VAVLVEAVKTYVKWGQSDDKITLNFIRTIPLSTPTTVILQARGCSHVGGGCQDLHQVGAEQLLRPKITHNYNKPKLLFRDRGCGHVGGGCQDLHQVGSKWLLRLKNNPQFFQDPPIVCPNYFSEPEDVAVLVEAVKTSIKWGQSEPFKKFGATFYDKPLEACSKVYNIGVKYNFFNVESVKLNIHKKYISAFQELCEWKQVCVLRFFILKFAIVNMIFTQDFKIGTLMIVVLSLKCIIIYGAFTSVN